MASVGKSTFCAQKILPRYNYFVAAFFQHHLRGSIGPVAFTLVEIVLALAIAVFTISSFMVLVPMGLNANRKAYDDIQALNLMSAIDADLRNTRPTNSKGGAVTASRLFGISPLPALAGDASYTYFFSADWAALPSAGQGHRATHRLTIDYTRVPEAMSFAPVEARLRLSWPASLNPDESDQAKNIQGVYEIYTAFPRL